MSFWSRITYAFRGDRLNHEIDEEFAAHIEEAIAAGDDPAEVRHTFGSQLRLRGFISFAHQGHQLGSAQKAGVAVRFAYAPKYGEAETSAGLFPNRTAVHRSIAITS